MAASMSEIEMTDDKTLAGALAMQLRAGVALIKGWLGDSASLTRDQSNVTG